MQNKDSNKNFDTKNLAKAAVIAALYAVVTIVIYPMAYGPIQLRISEAMCILPLLIPESVIGLSVGCLIANLFGNGILDVILGTTATFLAGLLTLFCRKIKPTALKLTLAVIPPILLNALLVPFTYLALTSLKEAYLWGVFTVGCGQAIAVVAFGIPLYFVLKKIFKTKTEKTV